MQFNEIKFQDAATKSFLGSPSVVRLNDGCLLATHDYFGRGCPRNHEHEEHLTSVYRSADDGATWTNVTHIANAFWSTLFTLGDAVYLIGASQQYGSIVIRRSDDNGNRWTHPEDAQTGLLFRGGPYRQSPNYHCAPVPMCTQNGRIYRAFEDNSPCSWPEGFRACVISAPVDADLLDAYHWTMSERLVFDPAWVPHEWGEVTKAGWLEGNIIEDRAGQLWNVLRFNAQAEQRPDGQIWDTACLVKVMDNGQRLEFDPDTGFIRLPGGHSKFTIRFDDTSGRYLTLSNGIPEGAEPTLRTVLSLYSSPDLREWRHRRTLIEDDSGLPREESNRRIGFQYVDWHFDGDGIIYLVRTAYDGADNYHNANRVTFHRLDGFRNDIA